jgi:hypothetical protein
LVDLSIGWSSNLQSAELWAAIGGNKSLRKLSALVSMTTVCYSFWPSGLYPASIVFSRASVLSLRTATV